MRRAEVYLHDSKAGIMAEIEKEKPYWINTSDNEVIGGKVERGIKNIKNLAHKIVNV